MGLFQRIFFAVLVAGLISGAAMAALHQWRVVPLILQAEAYEEPAAPAAVELAGEHGQPAHDAAWVPQDGFERTLYTVLAELLGALGFAFLLGAASVLSGFDVTARNGVIWGLAGFAVFNLAPALGLAPNLPGMPVADTLARQVWWWGAALATATAIFGMARFRNVAAVAIGIVLILAPHLVGAPQPPAEPSAVPAQLSSSFAAASLVAGAVFWLILGPLYGYMLERFARARAGVVVTA